MATYKPLQSVVLTSNTSSITFSGIDQNYTDLIIVGNVATSVAGAQNVMRFNGSTGNYSTTELYGTGSSVAGYRFSGQSYLWFSSGVGIGSTLGQSSFTVHLNNYANSTTNKTAVIRLNSNSGTYPGTVLATGLWSNTSPITSVTLYADTGSTNWLAGSTFDLYGIKSGAPQALGGDLVTTDGNYWYHAFTNTGAFIPQRTLTADVLVVAGGGAGASVGGSAETGGGGGAGGFRALSSQSLLGQSYTVTVGAGGASGSNGVNSSLGSISATGGGAGGGGTGGSGGGGLSANSAQRFGGAGNAGSYSPVEGYAGGNGDSSSSSFAGGGGGAGAAGANGVSGQSGAGGIGAFTAISGGSTTALGILSGGNYYFAGGGGGGLAGGNAAGAGGTGGGGAGSTAGTVNTGGGGGGRGSGGGSSPAGGSGIVIVRYAV